MRDKRVEIGGFTYYSGIDDLTGLSPRDKVKWLHRRFDKVVIQPLLAVKEIGRNNQAIWDLNLGVVTIICSAIEALGSFYSPGVKDEIAFLDFVHEFMDSRYGEQIIGSKRTYADVLYGQFRCGLAHGLTIEGHEVATRRRQYIHDDRGYVSIDLWSLFEDMRRARTKYIKKAHLDTVTQKRLVQRFDKLFIDPYLTKAPARRATGTDGGDKRPNARSGAKRQSRVNR